MSAETARRTRPTGPWAAVARSVVLLLSVFVTAWWLIGDLSYEGRVDGDLDYMMEAPDVPGWVTAVGGSAGAALAFVASRSLLVRADTRAPALTVLGVGVLAALMARVMTAGVIGANIGGGLSVMVTPLVGIVTIVALVVIGRRAGGQPR